MRLLLPSSVAALALVAPGVVAAPAEPATVVVATKPAERAAPGDAHKGSRVSIAPALVELEAGAPRGFSVPEGAHAWQGRLDGPDGKRAVVAVCPATGPSLLYVDANGDGAFDEATEKTSAPVVEATTGPKGAQSKHQVSLQGATCAVTVARRLAGWSGRIGKGDAPPVDLAFADGAPEGLSAPGMLAGTVRWATAKVGDATLHVAFARGEGDRLLAVVGAKDGFASKSPAELAGVAIRRGTRVVGTRWTTTLEDGATLAVVETLDNVVAQVDPPLRLGAVDVGGTPHVLHLADVDLDGAFTGAADRWWFGDAATWAAPEKGPAPAPTADSMAEGDAPVLEKDGWTWTLSSVSPDGSATLVRAHDPAAAPRTLARRAERVNEKRWFRRFEEEAEEFRKRQGIDPARAKASSPAPFRFALSLDEAKALAQGDRRPLLVDFEADWCSWCKRLDYYTYADAAVAERLSKFVAVKVNTDLDPTRSYRATGWAGIPAVAVYGRDGTPLKFRSGKKGAEAESDHVAGFLAPEAMVAALDAALAAHAAAGTTGAPAPGTPSPASGASGAK
jgi:hypothetical protein